MEGESVQVRFCLSYLLLIAIYVYYIDVYSCTFSQRALNQLQKMIPDVMFNFYEELKVSCMY